MQFLSFKQNKTSSCFSLISAFLILLLFIAPLSASAQDDTSIDTLRQMGKAFAKIAERASPAVVGIKATRTVTREYSTFRDWPFGDPFDDDFFERFFGRPRANPEMLNTPAGIGRSRRKQPSIEEKQKRSQSRLLL